MIIDRLEGFFTTLSLIFFSLFMLSLFGYCHSGPGSPFYPLGYIIFGFLGLSIIFFLLSTVGGSDV